uniref:Uncharacterized protein n=1 Tax=Opuntia streptacantha TaxID=393608 RepID=A0A7C9EVQ9_OPUST
MCPSPPSRGAPQNPRGCQRHLHHRSTRLQLKNQRHPAIDRLMLNPAAPPLPLTRHLAGGTWVHVRPFWVDVSIFKPTNRSSVVWKVKGGRRQSKVTFVSGARCTRTTSARALLMGMLKSYSFRPFVFFLIFY